MPFSPAERPQPEVATSVKLAPASLEDIDAIAALDNLARKGATNTEYSPEELSGFKEWLPMAIEAGIVMVLQSESGERVGYISVLPNHTAVEASDLLSEEDELPADLAGHCAYVGSIALEEEHQHKGLGTAAFDLLEGKLRGLGVPYLTFHTGEGNTAMLGLAEKRGYTVVPVKAPCKEYGDSALFAYKRL